MTHWLEKICDPDGKPIVQRPYLVRWRGEDWTAATDGRLLVLLRGLVCEASTSDVTKKLQPMLDATTSQPLNWTRFRQWIGDPPSPQPCRNCGGDGKCNGCHCETEHDCGYCDGAGQVESEPFPGTFRGHTIDCNRLARIAGNLGGVEVMMAWCHNPNSTMLPMLVIDGDGWRVCLMPMETMLQDLPTFEEAPCVS